MLPDFDERFTALKEKLEEQEREFDRQARDAQAKMAEAQARKRAIIDKLMRLERGVPSPETCLNCYLEEGVDRRMKPVAADDPTRFDRWLCSACGEHIDRPSSAAFWQGKTPQV